MVTTTKTTLTVPWSGLRRRQKRGQYSNFIASDRTYVPCQDPHGDVGDGHLGDPHLGALSGLVLMLHSVYQKKAFNFISQHFLLSILTLFDLRLSTFIFLACALSALSWDTTAATICKTREGGQKQKYFTGFDQVCAWKGFWCTVLDFFCFFRSNFQPVPHPDVQKPEICFKKFQPD